jgi:hypothetical protein
MKHLRHTNPKGQLSARLDNNRRSELNASQHRHFDHGYAITSHISQANDRAQHVRRADEFSGSASRRNAGDSGAGREEGPGVHISATFAARDQGYVAAGHQRAHRVRAGFAFHHKHITTTQIYDKRRRSGAGFGLAYGADLRGSIMPASLDGISLAGFSRPISIGVLRETRSFGVPLGSGIYLILRTSDCVPDFLEKTTGGAFKKRDPTCLPEFIRKNWVQGVHVVYVGKAAGEKGLQRRLDDLVAFGYGQAIGHWGGRLLWHLPGREKLLVRWRTSSSKQADKAETNAVRNFKTVYDGRRPYANLRK